MVLAYASKFFDDKEDIYILTAFAIIGCGAVSIALGASYIIATIILGAFFVNIAPAEGRLASKTFDKLIPPVIIVFFVVAGLELRPALLLTAGLLGAVYIVSRSAGLIGGAWLGCLWAKVSPKIRRYLGFAILSQAGVAIGLALLVSNEVKEYTGGEELGRLAITVIAATTVVFEIVGPMLVKFSVNRVRGPPKTEEEKIMRRLSRTATEVDILVSSVDEDLCVYDEPEEEKCVYEKPCRKSEVMEVWDGKE
jgi:Kef-type K+ transport system membrane component KefB